MKSCVYCNLNPLFLTGKNDSVVFLLEVLSILCMGDKTHSQLLELLPEKCGSPQTKDIDAFLTEVIFFSFSLLNLVCQRT